MIWLVLSIVLTVLLVVLNKKEMISDNFFEIVFPITSILIFISGIVVFVATMKNVNRQQNKESERGEIVRLLDERYAPD